MLQNFFNEKMVSGRADKKPGGLSPKTLKNIKCGYPFNSAEQKYQQLRPGAPEGGGQSHGD